MRFAARTTPVSHGPPAAFRYYRRRRRPSGSTVAVVIAPLSSRLPKTRRRRRRRKENVWPGPTPAPSIGESPACWMHTLAPTTTTTILPFLSFFLSFFLWLFFLPLPLEKRITRQNPLFLRSDTQMIASGRSRPGHTYKDGENGEAKEKKNNQSLFQ